MDLSIIIVNWNTKELLEQCLNSIFKSPPERDFDIWVVDNASSDKSIQMVETLFPQVNLIKSEHNLGFGKANNIALEKCQGTYILLLNPDTEVLPKSLDRLSLFLDQQPKAGVAGARLLYADGSQQTSCYPIPTLTKEFWRLLHLDRIWTYGVYDQQTWDLNQPRKVDVIQGAAFLVRKVILDQVGFFDPDYFMYTEEVDLCFRIQQAGWDLFWVPQATIVHYEGQSTRQMPTRMFLQLYQSKLQFFRKHHGRSAEAAYKIILALTSLPRLLLYPLSLLMPKKKKEHYQKVANNYQQLISALFQN